MQGNLQDNITGQPLNTIAGVDARQSQQLFQNLFQGMCHSTLHQKTRHVLLFQAPSATKRDKRGHLVRPNPIPKSPSQGVLITNIMTIPAKRIAFHNLTGSSRAAPATGPTKYTGWRQNTFRFDDFIPPSEDGRYDTHNNRNLNDTTILNRNTPPDRPTPP